jgi:hypothetical protein
MVVYIYYITSARSWAAPVRAPVRSGKGRRYGPFITYNITPAGSVSSSKPGWPPCWASSLAFGLNGQAVEKTHRPADKTLRDDNCVDVDVLALKLLSNEMDLAEGGVNRQAIIEV